MRGAKQTLLSLFIPIGIFACVLPARAGWFSYESYEDCMLGRMKGQGSEMWDTADKACKKEFHVEVPIYDQSSVKWNVGAWRTTRASIP